MNKKPTRGSLTIRRGFEADGGDVVPILEGESGKVIGYPAFGFPAGSVVFLGIDRIYSRSMFSASGILLFDVADIFGNATDDLVGFREMWGFAGTAIVETVRETTVFSFFNKLDWGGDGEL